MDLRAIQAVVNQLKEQVQNPDSNSEELAFFSLFPERVVKMYTEQVCRGSKLDRVKSVKGEKGVRMVVEHVFNDSTVSKILTAFVDVFLASRDMVCKSVSNARLARESGNEEFSKKRFSLALELYDQAISYASPPTEEAADAEYALAYANRSAVFFHLKKYNECLLDIDEALNNGYPSDRAKKLLKRRSLCVTKKDLAREEEGLEPAIEMDIAEPNPEIADASNAVSLEFNKSKGRHFIATRDIVPSEVLFAEKPFAHWLRPSVHKSHCFHCMKSLQCYCYPCKNCTYARFCSKACAGEAWKQYHHIECPYVDIFNHLGFVHLAFRISCIAGFSSVLDNAENGHSTSVSPEYARFWSLMDGIKNQKDPSLLYAAIACSFLTLLLEKLGATKLESKGSLWTFVHVKHILKIMTNRVYVNCRKMLKVGDYVTMAPGSKEIGISVYGTVSFLNHTCADVAYQLFNGSNIVVKAVDTIKKGAEVVINYGVNRYCQTRGKRRALLMSLFHFDCLCSICSGGEEFHGLMYRCRMCKGAVVVEHDASTYCYDCHTTNNDGKWLRAMKRKIKSDVKHAIATKKAGNYKRCKNRLWKCLDLADTIIWKNHLIMEQIHRTIGFCLAKLGHFNDALKHCWSAYTVIEMALGENTFELPINLLHVALTLLMSIEKPKQAHYATDAKCVYEKAVQVRDALAKKEFYVLQAGKESLNEMNTLFPLVEEGLVKLEGFQLTVTFK